MEEELKEIFRSIGSYLKKRRKKIIGWILFIYGIYSIIPGFLGGIPLFWGILLTIIGGFLLKEELGELALILRPYFRWVLPVGPGLVLLGIIFIVAGIPLSFFAPGILGWGIVFLIIGIPLAATRLVLKQNVTGEWAHLIEGAQGRAEEIYKGTEDVIERSEVSSIVMKRQELIPGFIRGALGRKREFLVVKDKHFRLKPYQFLLNAIDYGNNLDVAWYLVYRLSIFRALLTIIPFVNFIPQKIEDLDLFDSQDLTAFNTVCHYSVLEAVEKLMLSLNQDPSKMDRKSRGFLGVS
ncbi:MAG: hypothetical protein U9O41_02240 [Candidatus Aerophobetes bacterium]|nr:hypothetical protein [Candidatus Aerophobetes bacterium]